MKKLLLVLLMCISAVVSGYAQFYYRAMLPENHSDRLTDEQSSVSTALAYNIDSISKQVRFDMQMQSKDSFVPAPIQYDFYHRDIPFKEESISSIDKEEYYEKVPLDSMQAARKMAEDSLTNYAFDSLVSNKSWKIEFVSN